MKLSIVTINYNDAVGLKRTLDSVAGQATGDRLQAIGLELEHVIVDGGSTDNSVAVILDYESSLANNRPSSPTIATSPIAYSQSPIASCLSPIAIRWVSEKDQGIYDAMNKGVRMAIEGKADYIQILNSGDCLYTDDVIVRMYEAIRRLVGDGGRLVGEEKWPGIVYGNMIRCQVSGDRLEVRGDRRKAKGERRDKCMGEHEWTMLDFIKGTINHDPTWIRRDLYEKYGLYDPELKICSDWKWFVNAVIIGRGSSGESVGTVQPVYVPIDVTLFDVTGISETQLEKRETERWNEIRKLLPPGVVRDYELYTFPMHQVARLKKHHLWPLVYFMERVLFKLEKWGVLR